MTVRCKFENSSIYGYTCSIENQRIPSQVSEETFQDAHNRSFTNSDVKVLIVENSNIEKIPDKLGEVFKNLKELWIINSNLREISKENLRQFPNLEELSLEHNELEYLPGDLFKFNKNLEWIDLRRNKIKFIGSELLDGLPNLIIVNLQNNENISSGYNKSDPSLTLKELNEEIESKCKPPLEFVTKLEEKLKILKEAKVKAFQCEKPNNSKKSFENRHKDIDNFLSLEDFKDFTIKVGPKDFKVHKFIFLARSPTFAEMIKNNPDADELVLTDIPVEVFESILDFVYTDQPPNNTENVREIFAAAGKLKIQSLVEISAEFMMKEIEKEDNLDYLFENFNLGAKYKCEKLKLKAFEEINKQFLGGELQTELLEDPENLSTLIEAKKSIMKFMIKKDVGSTSK